MTLVAVLAPMTTELRPVVKELGLRRSGDDYAGRVGGADVVAALVGIGTAPAATVCERVLDEHEIGHVVVVGVAGGLAPRTALGDLLVAATVVDAATGAEYHPAPLGDLPAEGTLFTTDEFHTDPDFLAGLVERGIWALDMETSGVAAVCEARGIAWSSVRAVSDMAGDPAVGNEILGLMGPDGRPKAMAVTRYVLAKPSRARELARLGRQLGVATRRAARATARGITTLPR